VLLFCFAKPVMPVDTHVHRISQRVGLIGSKTSAEAAHGILLQQLPDDPVVLITFHKAMLKHGQQVCTWNSPRCERCVLSSICNYYQTRKLGETAPPPSSP
jgi:endonuclease III